MSRRARGLKWSETPKLPIIKYLVSGVFIFGELGHRGARVSASRRAAEIRHKYFARALDKPSRDDYIVYRSCETPGKPQFIKVPGSRWLPPWSGPQHAARIRKEKNGLVIGTIDTCEVGLGPNCSVFPCYPYFITPPNSQTPQ